MTEPVLTKEALLAAIKALGPPRPRQRLIVGFPLVGQDEFVKIEARGLWLAGARAWEHFQRAVSTEVATTGEWAVTRLMGIPVEEYDATNPDHYQLTLELASSLIKHIPIGP